MSPERHPTQDEWLASLGEKLFQEGISYKELRNTGAVNVLGTHLAYVDHPEFGFVSIHFREGLDALKNLKSLQQSRVFLGNLRSDLRELAKLLTEFPNLAMKGIWGLCSLSAKWGERHGFKTFPWSTDEAIIKIHDRSISRFGQNALAIAQPLTLFFHSRKSFIKYFGAEK